MTNSSHPLVQATGGLEKHMNQKLNADAVKRAIAGFVSLLIGQKVSVIWGASAGIRPGNVITLPPPRSNDPQEFALLTRLAMHEAGHGVHTDVESAMKLGTQVFRIFNLLEDPRMEGRQQAMYPGAEVILNRGLDGMLKSIASDLDTSSDEGKARALQMDILLRGYQAVASKKAIEENIEAFTLASEFLTERQRSAIDDAIAKLPTLNNSVECEELAKDLYARLQEAPPVEPNEQQEQQGELQADEPEQTSTEADESPDSDGEGGGGAQENNDANSDGESQSETGSQDQDAEAGGNSGDESQSEGVTDGNQTSSQDDEPADGRNEAEPQGDASQDEVGGGGQEQGEDGSNSDTQSENDGQTDADPGQQADEQSQGGSQDCGDQEKSGGGQQAGNQSDQDQTQHGDTVDAEGGDSNEPSPQSGDMPDEAQPVDTNGQGQGQNQSGGEAGSSADQQCQGANNQASGAMPQLGDMDLGTLLQQALEKQFGKADESLYDQVPEEKDLQQPSDELIEAIKLIVESDEPGDLNNIIELALSCAQDGDIDLQQNGRQTELPTAPSEPQPIGGRLDGVNARLVNVLLRELQDKRRRPVRLSDSGGRIAVQQFWKLKAMGETRVFKRQATAPGVEAACEILLDVSGSMKPSLSLAIDATLAFARALQRVGNVRTAIHSFPHFFTFTNELLAFGESPAHATKRCELLEANGTTPTGQAVLTVLPGLIAQNKNRKMLFVITDDGPDCGETLRRALMDATDNGVEVFGIGIGCDIKEHFPNSISVSEIGQLAGAMEQLFRTQVVNLLAA